jgi:hypothetical protein
MPLRFNPAFLIALGSAFVTPESFADVDVFGITELMPSKSPPIEWNSLHWAQGGKRTLATTDPLDPTGWSRKRGQTELMEIDGAGVLRMGGPQARLYFQGTESKPVFFRDVEFTGYFRRVGADGAANGGFVVGVRSGVNGHGEVDHCLANTYYLAYRYPGTWAFDKELDHPNDAIGKSGRLISGNQPLPSGRWIGMKYLAYNLPGRNAVKLEAYLDTVSDGNPVQGGTWAKVAEIVDEGNWPAPPGDCGYPATTVVATGGGVVFIRNTAAAEANYKLLSFREISVAPTGLPIRAAMAAPFRAFWRGGRSSVLLEGAFPEGWVRVSDLAGRRRSLGAGRPFSPPSSPGHGR